MHRLSLIPLIFLFVSSLSLGKVADDIHPALLPDVNREENNSNYKRTVKGDYFGKPYSYQLFSSELWHFADPMTDDVQGISVDKAYEEFKIPSSSKDIVVAVLDSGVDVRHKDLQGKLWVNKGEIWNDGIDNDQNGYVDDIFGWNFIGNSKGMAKITDTDSNVDNGFNYQLGKHAYQVVEDTLEMTRELVRMRAIENNHQLTSEQVKYLNQLEEDYSADLAFSSSQEEPLPAYYFDLTHNSRTIVGDNYADLSERYYGNNDVIGDVEGAFHGTHISGIIAANRLNDDSTKGIATNVRIMAIRIVPDGDERDKDVANGIRYAVDNGAKIINMSFGKSYKLDKTIVDQAVAYAESKGVIIVLAAGNSAQNNDTANNYPNRKNTLSAVAGAEFSNWVEVGASGPSKDKLAAEFSNFGSKTVDVFAPGLGILSLGPNNTYMPASGTSMAAPVVSGTLAALLNFVPNATTMDAKKALLTSVRMYPGLEITHADIKREFATLSITGGVINLFQAISKLKESGFKVETTGIHNKVQVKKWGKKKESENN